MAVLSFPFVIFDHLSKRADVSAIQKDLELVRAQQLANVVALIEAQIEPLMTERLSYDFTDNLISKPLPIFDDATKNKISTVLRQNEVTFNDLQRLRLIPRQLNSLNGAIFWALVLVATTALTAAGVLTFYSVASVLLEWVCLSTPILFALVTLVLAILRQQKVQYANSKILDNNSQA